MTEVSTSAREEEQVLAWVTSKVDVVVVLACNGHLESVLPALLRGAAAATVRAVAWMTLPRITDRASGRWRLCWRWSCGVRCRQLVLVLVLPGT